MDDAKHSASAGGDPQDDTDLGITRPKIPLSQSEGQEGQGQMHECQEEQASDSKNPAMNGAESTENKEGLENKSKANIKPEQGTIEENILSSVSSEQMSSAVSQDLGSAKSDSDAPQMASSLSTDSDIIRHEVADKLVDSAIQEASQMVVKDDSVPDQGISSLGEGLRHRTAAASSPDKQVYVY